MPARMTSERWAKIHQALWTLEIEFDSARCEDGGETEEVKNDADSYVREVTSLRKRIIRKFGDPTKKDWEI